MYFPRRSLTAITALIVSFSWAGRVDAGAWPRGEEKTFLSVSVEEPVSEGSGNTFGSFYYEYGLSPSLTFGLDIGSKLASADRATIAFFKHSFAPHEGRLWAIELGVGSTMVAGESTVTLRPGVSFGQGIATPWGAGWIGIDGTYALRARNDTVGKVTTTVGVNRPDGSLSILQFQFEDPSRAKSKFALAPSYVAKIDEQTFLEVGAVYDLVSDRTNLKLGMWFSF